MLDSLMVNEGVYQFLGLCNKLTQTSQLKPKEVYSPTVVDVRSLESRCGRGHTLSKCSRGGASLAPCSFWPPTVSGLVMASLQSLPLSSRALPPYPCFLLFCVSTYITKQTSTCSTHNATVFSVSHLEVLNSAKALFPSKVTFTGTGIRTQIHVLGMTIQASIGSRSGTFRVRLMVKSHTGLGQLQGTAESKDQHV